MSGAITAWSRLGGGERRLLSLVPTISLVVAMLAVHPAAAAASGATVVGTINGGGTPLMKSRPGARIHSVSSLSLQATLRSHACPTQLGDTVIPNANEHQAETVA